ncbi:hypothetical protein ACVW00_002725 [Marmoricola sp. URHA0025 HA25]
MSAPRRRFGTLVATARNASVGAPRLYRAARQAGASPTEALDVLATSAAALVVAARHGSGKPGRQNAVRHFTWQAVITGRHGIHVATAVADAQERGSTRLRDTAVDQRNNAAGQAWGHAHAHQLAEGSVRAAVDVASSAAGAKWSAGELAR